MKTIKHCLFPDGTVEPFRPIRIQHDLVTAASESGTATKEEVMEVAAQVIRILRLSVAFNEKDTTVKSGSIYALCLYHLCFSGYPEIAVTMRQKVLDK